MGDYNCSCKPGYTGKNCDIEIDECEATPCMNGGTCRVGLLIYHCMYKFQCFLLLLPKDLVNERFCICPVGFQGDDCSINFDDCDLGFCANGATCVVSISLSTGIHIVPVIAWG